ncbi:MAG: TRZ/ATZ family hydrolase [Gammaproteobacteria bacterium]|nr:TRZ/ATZ family hydrolase [Gammaproteobacteria bacterium]
MKNVQTLIHGKNIIPMDKQEQTLVDFSIAIQDGRILDILPSADAQKNYSCDSSYNYGHHIIIPGLINTHTHAAMSLFRGLANDLPLMEWLQNHVWPAEKKWANDDFVKAGTQLAIAEMLRGGIKFFNDMYFFAETTARVAAEAGIRAHIGMILLDFPTPYAQDPNQYIAKGLAIHDQYKLHPLVKCTFAPHAPYTISNAPLERVAMLANELELPVHIHLHETEDEIAKSLEQYQMRPLQRLHKLDLVNSALIAVHMTQLQEDEIYLLAETKANVVHCPESNLKLASGFCPVQQLIDKNINVALGTDSCASNDDLDMFSEIHTAALLAKGIAQNATALPAYQALRCATINAAVALGIDKETGSLEKGKSADITIIDIDSLEAQPIYDPVGHLVYATQRHQVSDVWVAGKQLLHNGQLKTLDKDEILSQTREWNNKIINSTAVN